MNRTRYRPGRRDMTLIRDYWKKEGQVLAHHHPRSLSECKHPAERWMTYAKCQRGCRNVLEKDGQAEPRSLSSNPCTKYQATCLD
ncbi:hypothetical protein AG1IA_09916 [Rhizoctonia solani AG-1 IA]|uniref:Uncharacterized protein n=1 Tax=Thanatephorus cucumeris (strain AG1-IA) TaxID=983506 RepID=L8WI55_THACA|nr:hypothetical protein AG1IA_09916 [Rhizoctonia solani AG-1 IA]